MGQAQCAYVARGGLPDIKPHPIFEFSARLRPDVFVRQFDAALLGDPPCDEVLGALKFKLAENEKDTE
jgi:hypothetical protein